MPEHLGRREQPRVLVVGVSPESDFGLQIPLLVPTVRFLEDAGGLESVRQGDFDVVVLADELGDVGVEPHLFVLKFGGFACDHMSTETMRGSLYLEARTVATEFVVPEDVPQSVARLIRDEVAPKALELADSAALSLTVHNWLAATRRLPEIGRITRPFFVDLDGKVIAARWLRTGGNGSEFWLLPTYTGNRERWLAAALAEWRELAPEKFPSEADWSTRDEWRTADEIDIAREASDLEREWQEALTAHTQAAASLEVKRIEATQAADDHERRLLTAQGDELVAEVIECLRELGFNVVNVDEEISQPQDRREDLRITDPDSPDWIALAEVRGYAKGAQLNDLLRLGRFVTRFLREVGREPDRVWYVVNHHRDTDPGVRPMPLESNPAEVETFAEGGGQILDTRLLFSLRKSLVQGTVQASEVRRLLREGVGQAKR